MMAKLSVAPGLLAGAITLSPHLVSAVPLSQEPSAIPSAAAEHRLTEEVQFGRCRYWRRVCAARWGWRTPRFFICMRRHAC